MLLRQLLRYASCTLAFGLAGAPAVFAADPIRLGTPLSLTGTLADEGMKEQSGPEMCVGQNEVASPLLLQIRNGNYVTLDPQDVKTGDLIVGVKAQ